VVELRIFDAFECFLCRCRRDRGGFDCDGARKVWLRWCCTSESGSCCVVDELNERVLVVLDMDWGGWRDKTCDFRKKTWFSLAVSLKRWRAAATIKGAKVSNSSWLSLLTVGPKPSPVLARPKDNVWTTS
jgi:hypothetical protein